MRLIRRRRHQEAEELNITSFMNLMVILVPFLLITAVFSRMAILEINIPAEGGETNQKPPEMQLEITVRKQQLELRDKVSGFAERFPFGEQSDWRRFSDTLLQLKRRSPKTESITLLVEPEVDYQSLISVMDRVRATTVSVALATEEVELFPAISIGDAAPLSGAEGGR